MTWLIFALAVLLLMGLAIFAGALIQLLGDYIAEAMEAHKFKRREEK